LSTADRGPTVPYRPRIQAGYVYSEFPLHYAIETYEKPNSFSDKF
jgi:hypothetical protein